MSVFDWPAFDLDPQDTLDSAFNNWQSAVQIELLPVYDVMFQPLPDNPVLLDQVVTQKIDGWLPRVASLAVQSEYWLNLAKAAKWPPKQLGPDGKPMTEADRNALFDGRLADYRFVRDELDALTRRMGERVRWAQSVRKAQGDAG